jgi:hypothetical protein
MNVELMQESRRRRHRSGRGSAWQSGRYRDSHLEASSRVRGRTHLRVAGDADGMTVEPQSPCEPEHDTTTQEGTDDLMMPLTPGAQLDELRRLLRESEQRRQAAEHKLADRERRLGSITGELARLQGTAAATVVNAYALDFPHLFKSNQKA